MTGVKPHDERHLTHRGNVLRPMVLGANDGIISTAALILGVAAASASRDAILTAGVAGLVAGAASMGLGEYVSVSSQRDSELADIRKETWELENQPEHELLELQEMFEAKGLSEGLAAQVAVELTQKDALKVHLEEELGITPHNRAQPVQAAASSATAFAVGASLPLLAVVVASETLRIWATLSLVLVALVCLGYFGARFGGARAKRPIARVVIGGMIAIAFTMSIGWLFGAVIA
jgi:VIT1/CCC1 family predicted Fe2+/Mn2+ transporter